MNTPKQPRLPDPATTPTPPSPHPLERPDERKEGGPDTGKADRQRENHDKSADDAGKVAPP